MIRIITQIEENATVVTIEGQVADSDLGEIQRVRESMTGAVFLNLRGVKSCAEGGARVLRDWLQAGAKLQAATPYLEMILNNPGN
jgi:hypothetical protein